MKKAYSIPKAKAQQKLFLQIGLLALAATGGVFSFMNLADYWFLLVGCIGIAVLAVRNIRCWLRVFAQNVGCDPLEVRH